MKRFKAICDQTRSHTWHVLDRHTGRKVAVGYPAEYARDVARAYNAGDIPCPSPGDPIRLGSLG